MNGWLAHSKKFGSKTKAQASLMRSRFYETSLVKMAIGYVLKGDLVGRTPVPWRFLPSARMMIVAVVVIATLLMGGESMRWRILQQGKAKGRGSL